MAISSLRNLIIGYSIAVVIVILMIWITFSNLRSQEKQLKDIRQAREALQKLGPLLVDLKDLESALNNSLVFNKESYAAAYREGVDKIRNDSATLTQLAVSQPGHREEYLRLAGLLHQMTQFADHVLGAHIEKRFDTLNNNWNNNSGTEIVSTFRNTLEKLEGGSRQVLSTSYNNSINLTRKTFSYVRIISAILIIILIVSFFLIYRDIRNRQKKQEQLKSFNEELEKQVEKKTAEIRASEKKYRAVIEQASDAIMVTDQQGNFTEVNSALCNQFGYTQEELLTLNISKLIDAEQLRTDPIRFDLLRAGQALIKERKMVHKDGTIIEVEANVKMIPDGRIMAIARDITERKKAAEQILKEKNLSDSVIDSLPGVFYLIEQTGKYLRWNKNLETVFGYSSEEIRNLPPNHFIAPEHKQLVREKIIKVLKEGYDTVEATAITKDGTRIPFFLTGNPVNYEGQPCVLGTGIDISSLKKAEEEKERARYLLNERIKELTTLYQAGQILQSEQKSVEEVLQEIASILPSGWQYKEVAAARIVLNKVEFQTDNFGQGAHKQTAGFPAPDGTKGMVEIVYLEQRPPAEEDAFLAEERDLINMIAEMIRVYLARTEAKKELIKSEANLKTIFETTDDGYALLDENFAVISYNQRGLDFVVNELKGQPGVSNNLIDFLPPDRRSFLLNLKQKVVETGHVNYEISYPQPDGSYKWYYIRMFPVTNTEKKILALMMAVTDITEKKSLEKQMLDQKVQEQKKITRAMLKAEEKERNKIGQELHDNVNQMLASIKLYLGMAKGKNIKDTNELLTNSSDLVDDAIEEIRTLSKSQVTPLKQINLQELIQSLVDKLNDATSLKTNYIYAQDGLEIDDDLKLNIYRIVQEQINNILKYAEASAISISIEGRDKSLHLTISDDGKGFDPGKKRKGIGISNMINRAESFNGELVLESSPGKGCKLLARIPC